MPRISSQNRGIARQIDARPREPASRELIPGVAGHGRQVTGIETGQRRLKFIARLTVNTHPGGSAEAQKALSEVFYESLNMKHGSGRVLIAFVNVYVVAVGKPLER